MKKISFLIPFLCILISSCSSDNDPISQNTDLDPVKYTVNLNIKSAGFEVDKTPLKSTVWNSYSFLQIVVYNESGTVYSDSIIEPTTLQSLVNENNTPQISLELPKGNYFLSILNRRMFAASDSKIEDFVIIPNNYETDYYSRKLNGFSGNQYIYYYTNSLTVTSDSNNLDSITLAPMWSTIQSPVVKYAPDFVSPVGSSRIYDQIAPTYFGFGIKSKLAKIPHSYIFKEFDHFDAGYVSSPFPVIVSEAEDSNLSLEICYIKSDDGYSGGRVLKIQKINLNTIVKNGMNYTISGTIPAIDSIDSNILNIGLEPFKDLDVSFQ